MGSGHPIPSDYIRGVHSNSVVGDRSTWGIRLVRYQEAEETRRIGERYAIID